jgi:ribose/xylose/arabinose/galactoside ABC-type transport system permease subunit
MMKKLVHSKIFTLLLLLAAVVAVYAVLSDGQFLAPNNIRNIFRSTIVVSLLTIGAGSLMIAGYIDLSLGGIGTMCAMLAAYLLKIGCPWYLAIAAALVLGGIAGLFNAVIVNEFNFQSFIATLATAAIMQGFSSIISSGKQIDISDKVIKAIGGAKLFDFIDYALIFTLLCLLVYGLILKRTKFGRSVYLIGGNARASRLAGIRPKRVSYTLFINAGVLSAIAGLLLAARLQSSNTTGITNSQFAGMTAAILGGISFGGGTGGMGGALVGILILSCFNNGMTVIDVPPYWRTVASGMLLLIALIADYVSVQKRKVAG